MSRTFSSDGCADAMCAAAAEDHADNTIDNAEIERLTLIKWKMEGHLRSMLALMRYDIMAGHVIGTPTRAKILAEVAALIGEHP